jgi:beta-phosphoglucomutase
VNHSKPEAIIFDKDGVLLDTEELNVEAERQTLEHFGIKISERDWPGFKGMTNAEIFGYVIDQYGSQAPHVTVEDLTNYKRAIYRELVAARAVMFPGAREFLDLVRPVCAKLGLTTSSSRETQMLEFTKFNLHGLFDAVITGDDVTHGKPHPEPYRRTIQLLEADSNACWVVEDSINGLMAARAAGCHTIGITTSFSYAALSLIKPTVIVGSFTELTDWMRSESLL